MQENSTHLFEFDKSFGRIIIGTDEAGRGPGAGGVFAAAVYFDKITDGLIKDLSILNDSKKLTPKKRDSIYDVIKNNTINKIVCVEVPEIETLNILNASLRAMYLACTGVNNELKTLSPSPLEGGATHVDSFADIGQAPSPLEGEGWGEGLKNTLTLVDGNKLIKNYPYPQQYIIKGDSKSASIAAASILAKVTRDRYMEKLDEEFPMYNWRKNAGYLTAEHLSAIDKYGLSPYHRPSFLKKHFCKTGN